MKCLLYISSLFFCFIFSQAQFTYQNNTDLESIIKSLEGDGVVISNISSSCSSSKANLDKFKEASGTLGIDSGLVLSTESLDNYNNYNNISCYNSIDDDIDLNKLISADDKLFDILFVEFDIEVAADKLEFDFVFTSEEYPFYTGCDGSSSLYNDVFGFFISGPGITGTKNLAVLPNSNIPVSVGTISECKNSTYYKENSLSPFTAHSTVLKAISKVTACEKYHLKLAIADVGDDALRSDIYIKSGSFTSRYDPAVDLEYNNGFPFVIEECSEATIYFRRKDQKFKTFDFPITFDIAFNGDATEGIDFEFVKKVVLPANTNELSLPFNAFKDYLPEGLENIWLTATTQTCLNTDIKDSVPISISDGAIYPLPDLFVCKKDTILLNKINDKNDSLIWEEKENISCTHCQNPTFYVTKQDTIKYTYIDKITSCQTEDEIVINTVEMDTQFDLTIDSINYSYAEVFTNSSSFGADTYEWDFGDGNSSTEHSPSHLYQLENEADEYEYIVKLKASSSEYDCDIYLSDTITIVTPFFIPNLLTNNNDNRNDIFRIIGIAKNKWFITIYNRWGDIVYQNEQYDFTWNGSGHSDGIYFYEIENPKRDRSYTGWIHLLSE